MAGFADLKALAILIGERELARLFFGRLRIGRAAKAARDGVARFAGE
jgi:hypothetical protein